MKAQKAKEKAAHLDALAFTFPAAKAEAGELFRRLRRLELKASRAALAWCNGEIGEDVFDRESAAVLAKVNALLGNVREYQPKTGARCSCKKGIQRDNCPACEGTGMVVDFHAIRNRPPLVPVFVNSDPRGYALKIENDWMRAHGGNLHRDMGGYGILAPDFSEG